MIINNPSKDCDFDKNLTFLKQKFKVREELVPKINSVLKEFIGQKVRKGDGQLTKRVLDTILEKVSLPEFSYVFCQYGRSIVLRTGNRHEENLGCIDNEGNLETVHDYQERPEFLKKSNDEIKKDVEAAELEIKILVEKIKEIESRFARYIDFIR